MKPKPLEENRGKSFLILVLEKNFLGYDTKSASHKGKNKQVGLHPTGNLLCNKRNHQQNEKTNDGMREKYENSIC